MKIATHADVVALERTPLVERVPHTNVYDLMRDAAARHADRIAIRYLGGVGPDDPVRDVTFAAMMARVTQTANALRALGVGPDDVVTLLMPGVPEAFFGLWGAEIAAVADPVNYFLDATQIAGIMKEAGARALIAADPSIFPDIWPKVETIRALLPDLLVIRVGGSGPAPAGVVDYDAIADAQPGDRLVAPKRLDRDTVAALFHTGGTTGLPKLARHTHGALALMAWTNTLFFDLGPGTVMFNPLPQFHVGGSLFGGLAPFASGWTVLMPTPLGARNPTVVREFWRIVERHEVNVAGAVPTSLAAIMNIPVGDADVSSLRTFVSGGSTVPVELIRRIEREIGVPVIEGYGMTEVHCYSTMNPLHGERRSGSVGFRVPYLEVRVADVDGEGSILADRALGEIGHVLMRGPQVFAGYVKPAHNKGAVLADGWLDSGDLGRLDADGYVWLTGRSKDLIIRGGHNIDPIVIEDALMAHPAVETCAAVGRPDSYAGELPVVFVQLRPGASTTAADLLAFARERVTERAAAPVEAIILDVMPVTGVGKIFKPTLRLRAAERVFDAAIEPLRARGVVASVTVAPHDTLGTLATIAVADTGTMRPEEIESWCRDALGGFQLRHAVTYR